MGRHSALRSPTTRPWPQRVAIGGLACALLGAGAVGAASVLKGSEPAIATCSSRTTVRVAAPAAVAPVVDQLTRSAEAGTCTDFQVATTSSYAVDRQLLAGGSQVPDVWISDSPIWVRNAGTALGGSALTTGPTIATSPVVVAVPKALRADSWAKGSPTWTQLLAAQVPLNVRSPQSSSATVTALATANESIRTENDRVTYFLAMLRLTRGLLGDDVLTTRATAGKDLARAYTASEQEITAFNQDFPNAPLSAVVPAGGAAQLTYQIVYPTSARPIPQRARDLLERTLTAADGKAALAAAGFRVPGDPAVPAGSPLGTAVWLAPEPSQRLTTSTIDAWNDLGRDDRMLVAVDGSGRWATRSRPTAPAGCRSSRGWPDSRSQPCRRPGRWARWASAPRSRAGSSGSPPVCSRWPSRA